MACLLGVQQFLLARVRDEPLALCLLARELARAADRFRLFPGFALGRFFIGPPLSHFAKHAFALHFLLQDAERLLDVVVANENLQMDIFLCRRRRCGHGEPGGFPIVTGELSESGTQNGHVK
jgi:hypothetical protein